MITLTFRHLSGKQDSETFPTRKDAEFFTLMFKGYYVDFKVDGKPF